jgi:PAS domain S-box-containing protein
MFSTEPASAGAGRAPLEDRRSRQLIEALSDGFLSLDADCRITDCNPAAERLFQSEREDLIGARSCDLAGLGPDSAFATLIEKVGEKGVPEEAEVRLRFGRRWRLLDLRAFPLGDGVGVIWRDITAARAAERRLALSEARYREIADGAPTAAWLTQADGKMLFLNQAMVDTLGRRRSELLGEGWLRFIDPDDLAGLTAARNRARVDHSSVRYEGHFRRPDGSLRIIQLYGRPRFDAAGAFCGHVGVAMDVTEARTSERRQNLLIHELNHRVKNTLATVQSLVRHTLRDHDAPKSAEQAVTARLLALSSAHNVLNRENWDGADLGEIARDLLQPYDRVVVEGPEARVSPRTAIALSMALQELATNAVKYGALSSPDGSVRLSWTRQGAEVELEWREHGGPAVVRPEQPGFGSLLLGRMLQGEVGHPAEVIYEPAGLVCRIRAQVAAKS